MNGTVTIQLPRDTAAAISDFAENMLEDAPDGAGETIGEAIRVISAAIQKHDKEQRQHDAEQAQRAEAEAAAAAIPPAAVRVQMTKTIRFKIGKVIEKGNVLDVIRRGTAEWHHDDDYTKSWWTVETRYTYTDPGTDYSYAIPGDFAKEVA